MKWQYDPKPLGAAKGVACCDVVNRGAAYADGTRLLQHARRADRSRSTRRRGQPKWITQLGDINKGETMTMAPLVVKGKVLVGNSGGEFGVRGWLAALDAATGAVAWRAYSTGSGHGRADRPALQAVLRERPRHGPRHHDLAGRSVADRRRHGLGLDLVRSRAESHLLRHLQPRARGTRSSGPATTSGPPACSPATRTPARPVVLPDQPARPASTTTASTSWCWWT